MDVINIEADEKKREEAELSTERATIDDFVEDANKRLDWKSKLRTANIEATNNRFRIIIIFF